MEENIFDKLNDLVNSSEGSIVNFLTAFAPWLAPLIPAYMTYNHMIEFLHFKAWLAWVLALVVEILGFGTVSTGLDFWFYNRRNKAKAKKAPFTLIIVSFCFYLGLIVMSNVLIDWAKEFGTSTQQSWTIIGVRFLLTLQTLPAALIVATRTGHRDLLREIRQEKLEKEHITSITSESTYGTSGSQRKKSKNMGRPSIHKEKVFVYMDEILERDGRVAPFLEVQRELGLAESTASRLRNEWLEENGYE